MKKLIIGLTGSFGTGKSTVGKLFKRFGAKKVLDADKIAHEVYRSGHPVGRKIKSIFKTLISKTIAGEVFKNRVKRKRLERLIHPYVKKRMVQEIKKVKTGIVVLEVPLLFESGFNELCDAVVSVLSGEGILTKRLAKRGFSQEEVRKRLKAQLPQSEKLKRSDFIIHNSGSRTLLLQRTQSVWKRLNALLN